MRSPGLDQQIGHDLNLQHQEKWCIDQQYSGTRCHCRRWWRRRVGPKRIRQREQSKQKRTSSCLACSWLKNYEVDEWKKIRRRLFMPGTTWAARNFYLVKIVQISMWIILKRWWQPAETFKNKEVWATRHCMKHIAYTQNLRAFSTCQENRIRIFQKNCLIWAINLITAMGCGLSCLDPICTECSVCTIEIRAAQGRRDLNGITLANSLNHPSILGTLCVRKQRAIIH